MAPTNWLFTHDTQPHRVVKELITTFAERLALEARKRAHERSVRRAEQSSELNSPEIRVRAWEKLHGLRLPSDPLHPILDVVANSTGLTRAQVLEEQRARAVPLIPVQKVQRVPG